MRAALRELWFLGRSRAAPGAILLLAVLASVAVAFGLAETARDRAAIAQVLALQAEEDVIVAARTSDAGGSAYGTYFLTWDSPSPMAFAALGQRDLSPSVLRVRALALEAQIYGNEQANPELALSGRFDLAFVAVYLAPLVLIVLLHDLWSGEREAGRLAALQAIPRSMSRIFISRAVVRAALLALALLAPFGVGVLLEGAPLDKALMFAAALIGVVVFWTVAILAVARFGARSTVNAAALASLWFVLTLVGPAAANLVVTASVPVTEGPRLVRENRDAVHGAWDLPRQPTLDRFIALYPEWADTGPMTEPFHWKWYFAFQHLGDVAVADLSQAYRQGIERRERLSGVAGWLMPPVGLQQMMHRLAETDVTAQLAYQDHVRAYHTQIREFYYPYLFRDQPFGPEDFAKAPRYQADGVKP